jgi:hypothetical protein
MTRDSVPLVAWLTFRCHRLLFAIAMIAGCGEAAGPTAGADGKADDLAIDAEPGAAGCVGDAVYQLSMELRWQESPPLVASIGAPGYPSDAEHVARIVGGVHGPDDDGPWSWQVGAPASYGVERTAEVNRYGDYRAELQAGGLDTFASDDSWVTTLELAPTQRYEMPAPITLTPERPMVTAIAMIAPSPDWFVGLSREPLCVDGGWSDARTFPLPIFDAGTEAHLDAAGDYAAPRFDLAGSAIAGGVIRRFEDSEQNQVGPLAASFAARFTTEHSEISWTFTRVE